MKKILVTGGAGYVGSVLIPKLIGEGYYVKCLDRFFFGDEFLKSLKSDGRLELIQDDIRWFESDVLDDIDVVMDLAALSNDPIGELEPEKTFEINHLGRVRVASLSKKKGVSQYILASSASIYGQQKEIADETSEVFPLTSYSKANRNAEKDSLKLNDNNFSVSVLRFSSIYGISPRMRFDISVNSMILDLFKTGKIIVRGKNNTRPFLHIKDAVKAYQLILKTNVENISGEIFNVGSDDQNFSMGKIAEEIKNTVEKNGQLELGDNNDHRSYSLSFEKIKKTIRYQPDYRLKDGIEDIYSALKQNNVDTSMKTITLNWYKHIQENNDLKQKLTIKGKIL